MTSFWLTFRIADDIQHHRTYQERYDALIQAVTSHQSGLYWGQSTSFLIFESDDGIGSIAQSAKNAIDPRYDLFLIRELDRKSAVIVGKNPDNDIYKIMPYLKKL
jgi:hypothetical protein